MTANTMQKEAQHLRHTIKVKKENNKKKANRVTASSNGQSFLGADFESTKISAVSDVDTDSQFRQDMEAALQASVQLAASTDQQHQSKIKKLNEQLLPVQGSERTLAGSEGRGVEHLLPQPPQEALQGMRRIGHMRA